MFMQYKVSVEKKEEKKTLFDYSPFPSGVSAKGFTSTRVASVLMNKLYKFLIWDIACKPVLLISEGGRVIKLCQTSAIEWPVKPISLVSFSTW